MKLFSSFEELEEAFTKNLITLDMYLNEYNRMIEEESDRQMRIDPPAQPRENT